ncbi:MAG TPA: hypothetical protein DIW86_00400 [Pseudomonas sp.]|nr:hypothetical protein [Pseudomonas sp.]
MQRALCTPAHPVGSRLAGDRGLCHSARLRGLIAGKPAPTGMWGGICYRWLGFLPACNMKMCRFCQDEV